MLTHVTCTYCGKEIEITEALMHDMKEDLLRDVAGQHAKELADARKAAEEQAKQKAAALAELTLKDKENEMAELRSRNKELSGQLLDLNKLLRELRDKNDKTELENQKRLSEEIDKARSELTKTLQEKAEFQILELKKQLTDTQKALAEANLKAQQKSQQLQGEVLELDLEAKLRSAFPHDEITPIAKGAQGGDVLETVRNSYGQTAGSILWETKRAKWSPSWLPKLREDGRKADASLSVLVSETLPRDIDTFGFIDNVLVTDIHYALPLATILRRSIMLTAAAKSTAANKDEKLEKLYGYLQSDTFRHRFEAYVEGIVAMQQDLETEKRSVQRLWKKRELDITRTLENIANMYGELQGIMGASLPDIKLLSLPDGEPRDT
ncbi:DUF2130 domain-containing protein [Patescibacteria group bacterium]|nr:DUF2130 domain-containing protein [Patescibacteria group bacterium]